MGDATPDAERECVLAGPLDLGATLGPLRRGSGDPTLFVGTAFNSPWREVWRAQRTPEGVATLRLSAIGALPAAPEHVHAAAWGPGAEWSVAHAPQLLGEGDDWSELDATLAARASTDPAAAALQRIRRRRQGLRLTRSNMVLEQAVPAVLEQKVTGVEARRAWRQLVRQHGQAAPGPAPEGLTVLPDGVGWRSIPDHDWHRAGVGPQRMATIRRVAAVEPALERTLRLGRGGPQAVAALCSIPGLGEWTAAEILQRSHGDPDAVSVGDAHLSHVIGTWFTGDRVDDAGMLELLAPYAGNRQQVVRLITSTGVSAARYGARATIEDHRRR